MGLNPPFGVNASLANKFITKALEFRPKILILIVPPETERFQFPSISSAPLYHSITLIYRLLSLSLVKSITFLNRLDKKKSSYVLIWEDKTFLSGNVNLSLFF